MLIALIPDRRPRLGLAPCAWGLQDGLLGKGEPVDRAVIEAGERSVANTAVARSRLKSPPSDIAASGAEPCAPSLPARRLTSTPRRTDVDDPPCFTRSLQ